MSKVFITAAEAEQILREHGDRSITANAIRAQAHKNPAMLGFPVCVVGTRVIIPVKSFYSFFGIEESEI